MRKSKVILLIVLIGIFSILCVIQIRRLLIFANRFKMSDEQKELLTEAQKMHLALRQGNDSILYDFFNNTFKQEIDIDRFKLALNEWRNNRKVTKVKVQQVKVYSLGGHITSWVTFNNKEKFFLFQSWIKTNDGWKLMWLTKILPQTFSYGMSDEIQIQRLKQLTLIELIDKQLLKQIHPDLPIQETLVVVLPLGMKKSHFRIPNHVIKQLLKTEITENIRNLHAYYYLEFAAIRVLDNIATAYVDIYPLYQNVPGLRRVRGLQLYFVRDNGQWKFLHLGTKW